MPDKLLLMSELGMKMLSMSVAVVAVIRVGLCMRGYRKWLKFVSTKSVVG